MANLLSAKLKTQKHNKERVRQQRIENNRNGIFHICNEILNTYTDELQTKMSGFAHIFLTSCSPDDATRQRYFTHQIVKFATKHEYYFNRFLPKCWFRLVFEISGQKIYQLIISLHHFGYADDSFAIGAILEFIESEDDARSLRNLQEDNFRKSSDGLIITSVPLPVKPYKLSLDTTNNFTESDTHINNYITEIITEALSQIVSEIT